MRKHILSLLLWVVALVAPAQSKFLGGDISLLSQYEAHGAHYLTADGQPIADMLGYFAGEGWNTMRVRLFVDPSKASATHRGEGVCQDLDYVVALGRRIKQAGFNFMLDFHYSDTWTDPGQHSTPSAWNSTSPSVLADSVYQYTAQCLRVLSEAGATPDFIQPGNEITYGMLWPTGHCYPDGGAYGTGTFANFARYLMAGIKACREVCPQAKVVIQTELSRAANVTNFYRTLASYTDDYDVIGLSYYPYYHGTLATLRSVIGTLSAAHPDKHIQLVETGYFHKWYPSGATYDLTSTWPATDEGQRRFTADLVALLNEFSCVDGLYWWFPEANEYGLDWATQRVTDNWYNASLWDNETGRVLPALAEMRAFLGSDSGIVPTTYGAGQPSVENPRQGVFDLAGRQVARAPLKAGTAGAENGAPALQSAPSQPAQGVYIVNGRKVVLRR